MKTETKVFLEKMKHLPWLKEVGNTHNLLGTSPVKNIKDAIKFSKTLKWSNVHTAILNRSMDFKHRKIDLYSKEYNATVIEIRTLAYALGELIEKEGIGNHFNGEIRGFICGAAFEVEFADIAPQLWYIPLLLPIFEAGHIPCGWDGKALNNDWKGNSHKDIPEGLIRVY
jgi:hypothetical protein